MEVPPRLPPKGLIQRKLVALLSLLIVSYSCMDVCTDENTYNNQYFTSVLILKSPENMEFHNMDNCSNQPQTTARHDNAMAEGMFTSITTMMA